jgi:uncharacterized protein YjbJ (UPF0337 family)
MDAMDTDRITGAAQNLGGKAQEAFGNVTGDERTRARGLANQGEGAVTETYGQAKDAVRNAADYASETVRQSPTGSLLTAAAIGFFLAWFMGRR